MRLRRGFGLGALISTIAFALGCCGSPNEPKTNKPTKEKPYFASFPMYYQSGMAMASGDFDKDGDLDVIVGVQVATPSIARLYFLENDGEGNFTLKQYPNKGN